MDIVPVAVIPVSAHAEYINPTTVRITFLWFNLALAELSSSLYSSSIKTRYDQQVEMSWILK